jgi:hypothetical protein
VILLRAVESLSAKAFRTHHYSSLGASETEADHLLLWKPMTDRTGCVSVQMSREDREESREGKHSPQPLENIIIPCQPPFRGESEAGGEEGGGAED